MSWGALGVCTRMRKKEPYEPGTLLPFIKPYLPTSCGCVPLAAHEHRVTVRLKSPNPIPLPMPIVIQPRTYCPKPWSFRFVSSTLRPVPCHAKSHASSNIVVAPERQTTPSDVFTLPPSRGR